MTTVTADGRTIRFGILIPSRGRPAALKKLTGRLGASWWPSMVVGTERGEAAAYGFLDGLSPGPARVTYDNPAGSVAVAREKLRSWAIDHTDWDYFVVTDDNAVFTEVSVHNLVKATAEYPDQPCIMAGMHNTAPHFDRHRIADSKRVINGLTSYANVGMIFQVYPRQVYRSFWYPADSFGLDDRYFCLWAIHHGITNFRICMDAPFSKNRYAEGGQGTTPERAVKCGKAIARLAFDFPAFVGATGTLRIPWQLILDMQRGKVPDRLAGGAMRKESALKDTKVTSVRVRVRKRR